MKTNKLFGFITLIAGVMLVLILTTCGFLWEEKHEHEWGPWGVVQYEDYPTCSTTGKEERMCTGFITGKGWCNARETRVIPPDPSLHIFGDPKDEDIIIEPTCTETGTGTSSCSNGCGVSRVVEVPVRHSFDYDEGILLQAPTCISSGTMEYVCTKCGIYGFVPVSPLGHSWVKVTDNPYFTIYRCSRCGIYY